MLGAMIALDQPLITPRLRLVPVTRRIAMAARQGERAFADEIGAVAPSDWTAASLGLVARSAGWRAPEAPIRAVAVHHEEDVIVGDVRFEPTGRAPGEIELGYGIAKSRRRQGYALEAAGAVIDWLFAESGAETIIAGCDRANLGSVRTLRKLGFWLDSNPGSAFWWVLTPALRSSSRA